MKLIKSFVLTSIFCISSAGAFADTITHLNVGPLPTSLAYSNSFASASSGSTFFDDFIFTIPKAIPVVSRGRKIQDLLKRTD